MFGVRELAEGRASNFTASISQKGLQDLVDHPSAFVFRLDRAIPYIKSRSDHERVPVLVSANNMNLLHVYVSLSSFQLGLLVAAAVLLWYGLLRVIYNVYFHPLSHFPGPRGAACTRLWLAYMELVKRVSLSDLRTELHQKYGKASQPSNYQVNPNSSLR